MSDAAPDAPLATAAWICYWTNFAMFALFWRRGYSPQRPSAPPAVARWGLLLGLVTVAVGTIFSLIPGAPINAFALGGLALLSVSLMFIFYKGVGSARWLWGPALVLILYIELLFNGYGRIQIVTLGLVALGVASAWAVTRWFKTVLVVILPVVASYLVALRTQLGVRETGRSFDGIGSLVSPLPTFRDLLVLDAEGHLAYGRGETFTTAMLSWVPRNVWPDKPLGFGSQLTKIFEPELLRSGHSMAALSAGEWYYNFGVAGMFMMVLVVGFAVRWLDILIVRVSGSLDDKESLLRFTLAWVLVASLPSLVWVGSFTYVARASQQIVLMAVVLIALSTHKRVFARSRIGV